MIPGEKKKAKYLNLISYFGGKYPHLNWLLQQFPKGNFHFVDIMCGSANVALNVDYPLVTINDLNDDVINLFEVLRNNHDEFLRQVYFTPFSRSELYRIIDEFSDDFSSIERARRFFVRSQLGWGANGSQNNHKGAGFDYMIQRYGFYRVDNWNVKLKRLAAIADKLRTFQIEHKNAIELFDKVNKPGTIVYFDPPYLLRTRKSKKRYNREVGDDFHIKLSEKLKSANCLVAVSGYEDTLYDNLFKGFCKTIGPINRKNVKKEFRKECLWSNYDPATSQGILKLNLT